MYECTHLIQFILAGLNIRTIPLNPPAARMGRPAIKHHFDIVDYHVSIVGITMGSNDYKLYGYGCRHISITYKIF